MGPKCCGLRVAVIFLSVIDHRDQVLCCVENICQVFTQLLVVQHSANNRNIRFSLRLSSSRLESALCTY